MYAEKAINLIKELERNRENLPPYNVSNRLKTVFEVRLNFLNIFQTDLVNEVRKEITELIQQIQRHE